MAEPTLSHQPNHLVAASTVDIAVVIPEPNPYAAPIGRYQNLGEVARGGMGVVLKVRDPILGRTLALKLLLEESRDHPDTIRRFYEEAQIGAQLQHPGIVPVHELGQLEDGRPFFTMKLVKGQTLADLLGERKDPTTDLPRFLQVFEQICQTVAFAHSRGIIHRDLKPSNIMVGAFGEVQVMDWGLAKVRGDDATPPAAFTTEVVSTIYTLRTSDSETLTQAGTLLGTPAFMPPEQARGQVSYLDERSDVFGLGAILSVILTGQPPYTGDREEVLRQAMQGDLTGSRTRLEKCAADPELVRLALACLAFAPLERPRDAAAVAEAVIAYRAGVQERLHLAEMEQAAVKVRFIERRKRRRVLAILGAIVLLAVAAGGIIWFGLEQKRASAERELVAALDRADELQKQGKWSEALAATRRAEGLLPASGDRPAFRQRVTDNLAAYELVQEFERIRTPAGDTGQRLNTRFRADAGYSNAFRDFGIDVDELTSVEAARRIEAKPLLKPHLVAALDDWVVPRKQATPDDRARWQRLLAVAQLVDPDPWRNRLREAAARDDIEALLKMAANVDVTQQSVSSLQMLSELLFAAVRTEAAIVLLRRLQWQHPGDFWVTYRLSFMLHRAFGSSSTTLQELLRCHAVAIALRPESGLAWNDYGIALSFAGRYDEAIVAAEKAIRLLPDHPYPHLNLANALLKKGDKDRAQKEYQRAVETSRRAVERDPGDVDAWRGLAIALGAQRQEVEAEAILRTMVERFPNDVEINIDLGAILGNTGRASESIIYFERALRLDPRSGLAATNLGNSLSDLGRLDQALELTRKGVALPAPSDGLALAFNNLGYLLVEKGGSLAEADQAIRDALRIDPDRADATLTLGELRRAQGRFQESLEAYRRGHELHARDTKQRWPTADWIKDAERLVERDNQLPDVVKGTRKPANGHEMAEFGRLCVFKEMNVSAVRFFRDAFAADPITVADPGIGFRYQAARAALLAAAARGDEAKALTEAERAMYRKQALDWLRADLALWQTIPVSDKPEDRIRTHYAMNHWRSHNALAIVRDEAEIAKLPKTEPADWRQLWSEVVAVQEKTVPR